mmetsp:Transcript_30146/g.70334  ORF Transcript_30146/g.70334 Transcript_30146/m.70334 type:complete len:159 (-) Transcript_30146:62-538(-)
MPFFEVAFPIGSTHLPEAHVPYGCPPQQCFKPVRHHPVRGALADMVRALWYTRASAEDLGLMQGLPDDVHQRAAQIANYANDLELVARQIGLATKMPTMVTKPFLPVDISMAPAPVCTHALLTELLPKFMHTAGGDAARCRSSTPSRTLKHTAAAAFF